MHLTIITLGIAVAELLLLTHMLRMNKIKLLTNYKYLVAQYKVEQIQKICYNKQPEQAIKEIKDVLNLEMRIKNGTNNKVLYNK